MKANYSTPPENACAKCGAKSELYLAGSNEMMHPVWACGSHLSKMAARRPIYKKQNQTSASVEPVAPIGIATANNHWQPKGSLYVR